MLELAIVIILAGCVVYLDYCNHLIVDTKIDNRFKHILCIFCPLLAV